MHWYVDVDQLPLEGWCIYDDGVYRAFQMEKDGFGKRTHQCQFSSLLLYEFLVIAILFTVYVSNKFALFKYYHQKRAPTLTTSPIPSVTCKFARVNYIFKPRFTPILTGWYQSINIIKYFTIYVPEKNSQRHLTESLVQY